MAKTLYRHVILTYPKLPPFHILERKDGDWVWVMGTQDREFFIRFLSKSKTRISETVERDEE